MHRGVALRIGAGLISCASLIGCASQTQFETSPSARAPGSKGAIVPALDLGHIREKIGMTRERQDLGFSEKAFDGCKFGVRGDAGKCGERYFTLVHFRLVCRDTEETVAETAKNFKPLVTDHLRWKLAGQTGEVTTDSAGFGQVQALSNGSLKGQRLVLIAGKQFLGLDISEVSRIVVPVYWCL